MTVQIPGHDKNHCESFLDFINNFGLSQHVLEVARPVSGLVGKFVLPCVESSFLLHQRFTYRGLRQTNCLKTIDPIVLPPRQLSQAINLFSTIVLNVSPCWISLT